MKTLKYCPELNQTTGSITTYYIRNDEEVNKLLENQHCSLPYSKDYPSSKTNPIVKDRLDESPTGKPPLDGLFALTNSLPF